MNVTQLARRLFLRSEQKRRFVLPRLLAWLFIIGAALVVVLLPGSSTYAAPASPTGHRATLTTHQSLDSCPPSLQSLQWVCSAATQLAAQGGGAPSGNALPVIPNTFQVLLFFTDPQYTVGNTTIVTIWAAFLGIVDAFMITMIVINAIRMMISGSIFRYADLAETMPRVLLALIVAHISLAIVGLCIGFSNGLSTGLYSFGQSLPYHDKLSDMLGFGAFHLKLGFSDMLKDIWKFILTLVFGLILFIAKTALMLMLAAQMVMRLTLIDLYLVVSGPCLACTALPGRSGHSVTQMWLRGFLSLIFVQSVQGTALFVGSVVFGAVVDVLNSGLNSTLGEYLPLQGVLPSFFGCVLLWFVIRVPGLVGSPPVQMMTAGGQIIMNLATSAVNAAGAAVMR